MQITEAFYLREGAVGDRSNQYGKSLGGGGIGCSNVDAMMWWCHGGVCLSWRHGDPCSIMPEGGQQCRASRAKHGDEYGCQTGKALRLRRSQTVLGAQQPGRRPSDGAGVGRCGEYGDQAEAVGPIVARNGGQVISRPGLPRLGGGAVTGPLLLCPLWVAAVKHLTTNTGD